MIKSKKQMYLVIGAFALVMLLGTVTYAFFNYTRTGSRNLIKVGRISFESKNEETITLNNLFPIDPSNTSDMNDSTKVGTYSIDIKGDTDYVDGIEYLVSATDANIYTNQGQIVPITLDVTTTGLGNNNPNYFTARESKDTTMYKKIVGDTLVGDQMLLVGFIKKNTTSGTAEGVNGKLTIKAYLDKNKILISDTYDGTESDNMGTQNSMAQGKTVLTTTEWNALNSTGVSFKVKVEANEGIWVKGSLEEIMRKSAVMDNINSTYVNNTTPGINFGAISSDTNGKGVYMRAGTQNDAYPIVYYRGAVEDNNVVFNNKCWKAVRTTDTGGVKLIYNGEKSAVYEKTALTESQYTIPSGATNNFTFNSTDNSWEITITDNAAKEISFTVPAGDNYKIVQTGTSGASSGGQWTFYKDGTSVKTYGNGGGQPMNDTYEFGTLTSSNVIRWTYTGSSSVENPITFKLQMVQTGDLITENGCDNSGTDAQITLSGTNTFPFSGANLFESLYKSLAYNGYMWGEVYEWTNAATTSGAYYGTGFTWDGTNYTLTSAKVGYDGTHHYTCNLTTAEGTCSSIRYYYYVSGTSSNYYITLTGGDSIEKAIEKMQTNTNPSNAKTQIDIWYAANMSTVTSKLEDTIWCNDRSISSKAGWDPTGNVTGNYLYYSPYDRAFNTNVPSLSCANKNDAFTVSNGNGNQKLTYPVALLTSDEMTLAGGKGGRSSTFYLASGTYYWSLSPSGFDYSSAAGFRVFHNGNLGVIVYSSDGLRPAVSLKPGTPVVSGDGTTSSPYRIG